MAAVILRAYLQCMSVKYEWVTPDGFHLRASDSIKIILGEAFNMLHTSTHVVLLLLVLME